jgi:hypothetical protein
MRSYKDGKLLTHCIQKSSMNMQFIFHGNQSLCLFILCHHTVKHIIPFVPDERCHQWYDCGDSGVRWPRVTAVVAVVSITQTQFCCGGKPGDPQSVASICFVHQKTSNFVAAANYPYPFICKRSILYICIAELLCCVVLSLDFYHILLKPNSLLSPEIYLLVVLLVYRFSRPFKGLLHNFLILWCHKI